ncbi:uncharacterized, partial [Tachysurus ichikawai]
GRKEEEAGAFGHSEECRDGFGHRDEEQNDATAEQRDGRGRRKPQTGKVRKKKKHNKKNPSHSFTVILVENVGSGWRMKAVTDITEGHVIVN